MDKEAVFTVDEDNDGVRIDLFLSGAIDELSRSYISRLIADGKALKNDVRVKKSSEKVLLNDRIRIFVPESTVPDILPENIALDILYEDNDVIVVNKPKGMVVHPSAGHYSGTLVNALMYHCKDLSGINGVLRPGIVHRIDMDTTGSVIACKNDRAHLSIAKQLKEHSVKRLYRAIVNGSINEDGTVDKSLGRSRHDRKKMAVVPDGKNAVTHYRVLENFGSFTYIECRLETGRTHQIRVHMASIGHPVMGDALYGSGKCPYKTEGQVLHAYYLGFIHPVSGEYIETAAPLPEYFEKILKSLRKE